jgi:membrane protease YdiL (CAAX protease family)
MTRIRRLLFRFLTLLLIWLLIDTAWFDRGSGGSSQEPGQLEVRVLEFQAQLLLGLDMWRQGAKLPDHQTDEVAGIGKTFTNVILKPAKDDGLPHMRRKLILAWYLNFADEALKLKEALISRRDNSPPENYTEQAQKIDALLVKLSKRSDLSAELATEIEQADPLLQQMGWFGSVLEAGAGLKNEFAKSALNEAGFTFQKVVVATFFLMIFFVLSAASLLILLWKIYRGKLQSNLLRGSMEHDYLLEVFCLYLGIMFLIPLFFEWLGQRDLKVRPIPLQIAISFALPLLLLWPTFFGERWSEIRRSIGVWFGGVGTFIKNSFAGPLVYLAMWIPFLAVLTAYSFVLSALEVDPSSGGHPIVPVLTGSDDRWLLVQLVVLAVIVAPFIEEIMFRGVLYGWLRSRFGALASMVTSALIFAAVHPQGALGVIPLTFIGVVLALLREWRGSLIAPMLAHACVNAGTLTLVLVFLR